MNKSRNQNVFSTLSAHNKIHLFALFGLFTDRIDRFPYSFIHFSYWNLYPIIYTKPEKGTPFGRCLTVWGGVRLLRHALLILRKKSDGFAVYNYHGISLPPLSPEPPARGFVNALLEWGVSLAWVSGVSEENGKDGREKGRELKERNAWHRCFYWSLAPPRSMMVLCQAFLSLLPLPASPSKISSPLAPWEGLILRLVWAMWDCSPTHMTDRFTAHACADPLQYGCGILETYCKRSVEVWRTWIIPSLNAII